MNAYQYIESQNTQNLPKTYAKCYKGRDPQGHRDDKLDIDILLVAFWTDDIVALALGERAEERVAHLAPIFFGQARFGKDNLWVGLQKAIIS